MITDVPMKDRRRLMWIHLSALLDLFFPFFSWLGPLIFWQWGRTEDPELELHGRAAFRFQLSWWLYRGFALFLAGILFIFFFIIDRPLGRSNQSHHSVASAQITVTDEDVANEALDLAQNNSSDAEEEEENLKAEPIFPDSPDQDPSTEDDDRSNLAPNISNEPNEPISGPDQFRKFLFQFHLDDLLAERGLWAGIGLVTLICLVFLLWISAMFFALVNGMKSHSSDELIYPLTLPFFKK